MLARRLIDLEQKYGGKHHAERRKVSPHDPRTSIQIATGMMQGGDRMGHHGYAEAYAKHLGRLIGVKGLTIVECGILRGVGLAVWSELFPDARLIGLDIDLSHFEENKSALMGMGAFQGSEPEVYLFDQLDPRPIVSATDIFIDDGLHSNEAVAKTYDCWAPLMADGGIYFIEDNANVQHNFQGEVHRYGELTVVECFR